MDLSKFKSGHPEFYKTLYKMAEIHNRKNQDYGGGDPVGNFYEAEKLGISAWKGCLIRLTDKYSRVINLASGKAPAVEDEKIEDTLIDLANYAVLTLVLLKERKSELTEEELLRWQMEQWAEEYLWGV